MRSLATWHSAASTCFQKISDSFTWGRTNRLSTRLQNHCRPSGTYLSATFAFRIVRADTGLSAASYKPEGAPRRLVNTLYSAAHLWRPRLAWREWTSGVSKKRIQFAKHSWRSASQLYFRRSSMISITTDAIHLTRGCERLLRHLAYLRAQRAVDAGNAHASR